MEVIDNAGRRPRELLGLDCRRIVEQVMRNEIPIPRWLTSKARDEARKRHAALWDQDALEKDIEEMT